MFDQTIAYKNIPLPIILLDKKGVVVNVNSTLEQLLMLSAEQVFGIHVCQLFDLNLSQTEAPKK